MWFNILGAASNPWVGAIIGGVVSLVVSGILIPIVTKIVGNRMTKYFDERDALKRLQENERQKEVEKVIDNAVEQHTTPIDKELSKIVDKLSKVADGTLDTLRDRILSSYYKCLEKGYRTQYDIDNVNHMYKDYLNLDGNTFVEECMEKFKNIPTEKEFEIIKKQKEEELKAARKAKRPRVNKSMVAHAVAEEKKEG